MKAALIGDAAGAVSPLVVVLTRVCPFDGGKYYRLKTDNQSFITVFSDELSPPDLFRVVDAKNNRGFQIKRFWKLAVPLMRCRFSKNSLARFFGRGSFP